MTENFSIALKLSPCVWGSQVQTSPTYLSLKTIAQEAQLFFIFIILPKERSPLISS